MSLFWFSIGNAKREDVRVVIVESCCPRHAVSAFVAVPGVLDLVGERTDEVVVFELETYAPVSDKLGRLLTQQDVEGLGWMPRTTGEALH